MRAFERIAQNVLFRLTRLLEWAVGLPATTFLVVAAVTFFGFDLVPEPSTTTVSADQVTAFFYIRPAPKGDTPLPVGKFQDQEPESTLENLRSLFPPPGYDG